MEKLTIVGNFTKSVESLRNTECSQKDKLNHFHNIHECMLSPAMVAHPKYTKHCSSAIVVLLLFCEDLDSVVRMNAEENLNKIIRALETTRLSRVLADLFGEIRKNGNDRSLRICLNLFSYYCPRIKEKNIKWYALKIMPCLQAIAERKETLLIETLCEFMKSFSKYLQICLNDNETSNLIEVFLSNITSECPIKRRCSSQNCVSLIENARNKPMMTRLSLNKCSEFLITTPEPNTFIGVLGFYRLLIPLIIEKHISCDYKQIIEIYDFCLHILNCNQNHSVVNASLEVINSILNKPNKILEELLSSNQLKHNEIVKKEKSLKNQIFQLKNAPPTKTTAKEDEQNCIEFKEKQTDKVSVEGNASNLNINVDSSQTVKSTTSEVEEIEFKSCREHEKETSGETTKLIIKSEEDFIEIREVKEFDQIPTTKNGNEDISRIELKPNESENLNEDVDNGSGRETGHRKHADNNDEHKAIPEDPLEDAESSVSQDFNFFSIDQQRNQTSGNEDKLQLLSDIDNESFNSIDFESEIAISDANLDEKCFTPRKGTDKNADLKSQKSTESIGSFITNFLSHSNTESVTRLFRPSTKISGTTTADSSTTSTPKGKHRDEKRALKQEVTTPVVAEGQKEMEVGQTEQSSLLSSSSGEVLAAKTDTNTGQTKVAGKTTTTPEISSNLTVLNMTGAQKLLSLEYDTISLESINSHMSLGSHVSLQSNFVQDFARNEQDLVLVHSGTDFSNRDNNTGRNFEILRESVLLTDDDDDYCRDKVKHKSSLSSALDEQFKKNIEHNTNAPQTMLNTNESNKKKGISLENYDNDKNTSSASLDIEGRMNSINIGTIYDQSIINYTARLISLKFLLSGKKDSPLISDSVVRVSIKNLSLNVIGSCINMNPSILTLPLEFDKNEILFLLNSLGNRDANSDVAGLHDEIDGHRRSAIILDENRNENSNDKMKISSGIPISSVAAGSNRDSTGSSSNDFDKIEDDYRGDYHQDISKSEQNEFPNSIALLGKDESEGKEEEKTFLEDNLLEIKDDHFGENTNTLTMLFLNLPLSKSADPVLLSNSLKAGNNSEKLHSNQTTEEGHNEQNKTSQLCKKEYEKILSKSEIIESTTKTMNEMNSATFKLMQQRSGKGIPDSREESAEERVITTPTLNPSVQLRKANEPKRTERNEITSFTLAEKGTEENISSGWCSFVSPGKLGFHENENTKLQDKGEYNFQKDKEKQQHISDILLYYNHCDPVLRGDVQTIVGNFIFESVNRMHFGNGKCILGDYLNMDGLLAILIKGYQDEIHTVVVQALITFDRIFPFLIKDHFSTLSQENLNFLTGGFTVPKSHNDRDAHGTDADDDDGGNDDKDNKRRNVNKNRSGDDNNTDNPLPSYSSDLTFNMQRRDYNKIPGNDGNFSENDDCEQQSNEPHHLKHNTNNNGDDTNDSDEDVGADDDDDDDDDGEEELLVENILKKQFNITKRVNKIKNEKKILKSSNGEKEMKISVNFLLDELHLCFFNKYWLVQNKYSEVISNLDYELMREYYDNDIVQKYEELFLKDLFKMLGDGDSRVRDYTAECISHYILKKLGLNSSVNCESIEMHLLQEYLDHKIFWGMSSVLRELLNSDPVNYSSESAKRLRNQIECKSSMNEFMKGFSKVLYLATNYLIEIENRHLLFGALHCVKVLLNNFNPVDFFDVWNEYKILEICINFTYENHAVATDLNCQIDLIEICSKLLAATALSGEVYKVKKQQSIPAIEKQFNQISNKLFTHVIKLLNIYYHLLGNRIPVLFPKTQKGDLFTNAREMAAISNIGYFGNDYLYIRIYNILKTSFESFKITINQESGSKLMSLLTTCLRSLSLLLEITEIFPLSTTSSSLSLSTSSLLSSSQVIGSASIFSSSSSSSASINSSHIKIIEEILQYLNVLINYEPTKSIDCLRQLLKFLFGRNYACRKEDYENLINSYFIARNFNSVITMASDTKSKEGYKINSKWNDIICSRNRMKKNSSKSVDTSEESTEKGIISECLKDGSQENDDLKNSFYKNISEIFKISMNFPLRRMKQEESSIKYIKLFEPLVVYCLTLFMKSNSIVQKPILDLLSQLLEFNVTYSMLDSKSVIFDQVIKNLELIENGNSRNSKFIITSIVKFLIGLTKQTDKKLITIPKIISIINNLLANNTIRECSVLALKVLTFEIFLIPSSAADMEELKTSEKVENTLLKTKGKSNNSTPKRIIDGNSKNESNEFSSFYAKELSAQKEVVLGILEKFIGSKECQKTLSTLLLWNRTTLTKTTIIGDQTKEKHFPSAMPMEKEESLSSLPILSSIEQQTDSIHSVVIKGLLDGKIKINNMEDFFVLDSLFKKFTGKMGNEKDEKAQFMQLLSMLIAKSPDNFNDLSYSIIILNNIIPNTEEIYLLDQMKLYLAAKDVKMEKKSEKSYDKIAIENPSEVDRMNYSFSMSDDNNEEKMGNRNEDEENDGREISCSHTDEITYFVKVLNEKLNTCFSTLIKCPYDNDFKLLVVKFVRSLSKISNKNAINSALHTKLAENLLFTAERIFSVGVCGTGKPRASGRVILDDMCSLECQENNIITDKTSNIIMECLGVEILKVLCEMNLDKMSIFILLEKFPTTEETKKRLQRIILKKLCEKFEDIRNWSEDEVHILLSNEFLESLIREKLKILRTVSEIPQYGRLLVENLLLNHDFLRNEDVPFVLKIIHSTESSLKVDLYKKLQTKYAQNKCLTKLICAAIKKVENSSAQRSFSSEDVNNSVLKADIDEKWMIEQIIKLSSARNSEEYVYILLGIKSESKLKQIFNANEFNWKNVLRNCIKVSYEQMLKCFQNDCVQYNPHINYMNMNTLAKISTNNLIKNLSNLMELNLTTEYIRVDVDFSTVLSALIELLKKISTLKMTALLYIEMKFVNRFLKEHIFKSEEIIDIFINSVIGCCYKIEEILKNNRNPTVKRISTEKSKYLELDLYYRCIDTILKEDLIWLELNQPEKYGWHLNKILDIIYLGYVKSIRNTIFFKRYRIPEEDTIIDEIKMKSNSINNLKDKKNPTDRDCARNSDSGSKRSTRYSGDNAMSTKRNNFCTIGENTKVAQKAIFVGKLIENEIDTLVIPEAQHGIASLKILKSIAVNVLRTRQFYIYAITPKEVLQSFNYEEKQLLKDVKTRLPSIPIDLLSDVEILHKFVKRISIFGFSIRQQFEEFFMTFLLLINKLYDENMVDLQEQFQIKSTCLTAILELLITCKTFPSVGNRQNSKFHHTTRWPRIKCDIISLKKLHKIQLLLPMRNVFTYSNLERSLSTIGPCDNLIGTSEFLPNQHSLNFIWQLMEANLNEMDRKSMDVNLKNVAYFTEMSEIDFKSTSQLIFDIFTQLIEQNHMLALPNLVKFCEICDDRDQIKWINIKMLKLHEIVSIDDTISHQYIIYLLCKTQSILIPSCSDLSHLCSIISTYLRSSHVFIRNATLHGLLSLLECCSKTSTSIGKLSEELSLLRDLIVGYINRHGIMEESSIVFSDIHTKLVWTLNYSLIETTSKFVPDCHLLSNSLISANNSLKRTTNERIYLCILHGLERMIVLGIAPKAINDRMENFALELVKMENERFCLPALKLLLSCIYVGSSKQLENTELSNGIVQDDPEIIVQQTEKVDVLLHCIKSSIAGSAEIYGEVLCQIIRDLVPPNEILTKVIKEFLAINQPHCEVIARIVYQVFRSAIDSSFLQMLQDWLICSLPTFVTLPEYIKGVWCLTVIFLSASINLNLIQLFPIVLYEYRQLDDPEVSLFITSAQDFYRKLNGEQKKRFREAFEQSDIEVYQFMLKSL